MAILERFPNHRSVSRKIEYACNVQCLRALCLFAIILAGIFFLQGCAIVGKYGPGAGQFRTVVLDAGHGGQDRGARPIRGQYEKKLALDVTQRTASLLLQHGYRVILTREDDRFIPLGQRTNIANRTPNSIFVSIHFNWARRRHPRGIETYYHTSQSKRLAANILQELIRTTNTPDRGLKSARYYVLRHNTRPAALLELGFVSNATENKSIQDPKYRQRLAEAIVRGIEAERSNREPR